MSPRRLVVAICTYRRPELLRNLLAALPERLDEVDAETEIVVVDNDPAGSARDVVQGARDVRYVHEPSPGIAAARSTALAQAGSADLLAFIDDDEIPLEGWLRELVAVWERTGAAAVAGRVRTVLPPDIDPFLRAMGYFARAQWPTGTSLPAAATSNLLLDLQQVRAADVGFDPSLGLSGGEDTLFTYQLTDAGHTIVWCHESVVDSPLSAERLDRDWALQRVLSHGNTDVEIALRRASGPVQHARAMARWTAAGLVHVALGAARRRWGRWRGDLRHEARGTRSVFRGRGVLAGVRRERFHEYHRSSTSGASARTVDETR